MNGSVIETIMKKPWRSKKRSESVKQDPGKLETWDEMSWAVNITGGRLDFCQLPNNTKLDCQI